MIGLNDFAPDSVTLHIDKKEYSLKYSYLSLRELEACYETEEEYNRVAKLFAVDLENIKREDIINFLYAGLLHTDLFEGLIDKRQRPWKINREGCKELLSGLLIKRETYKYTVSIINGWVLSNIPVEMAEMMEVMAASNTEKKSPLPELGG